MSTKPVSPPAIPYTAAVEKRAAEEGSQAVRICGGARSEMRNSSQRSATNSSPAWALRSPVSTGSSTRPIACLTSSLTSPRRGRRFVLDHHAAAPKPPGAAGVIHSDFEKGFIKADCYASDDLFALAASRPSKKKGLLRSEGKEYVVKDGDILFFKFNV